MEQISGTNLDIKSTFMFGKVSYSDLSNDQIEVK
jgi:hypothetical protein